MARVRSKIQPVWSIVFVRCDVAIDVAVDVAGDMSFLFLLYGSRIWRVYTNPLRGRIAFYTLHSSPFPSAVNSSPGGQCGSSLAAMEGGGMGSGADLGAAKRSAVVVKGGSGSGGGAGVPAVPVQHVMDSKQKPLHVGLEVNLVLYFVVLDRVRRKPMKPRSNRWSIRNFS